MDWKEISRTPVPYSVRLYPGLEGSNSAYALANYVVKQYRVASDGTEWRSDIVETPLLKLSEHPELECDFRVALITLGKIERACFCASMREGQSLDPSLERSVTVLEQALTETRNVARSFWKSLVAQDDRALHDYATWVERCPWLDEEFEDDKVEEDSRMV
jgi:hypothetical protein